MGPSVGSFKASFLFFLHPARAVGTYVVHRVNACGWKRRVGDFRFRVFTNW
jgi:hypothetical protein